MWITLIVLCSVLVTTFSLYVQQSAIFFGAFQLSCSACQRGATLRQVLVDVDFVLIVSVAVAHSAPCPSHFGTHVDSIEAHNDYTMSIAVPYPLTKPMASQNVLRCNSFRRFS